jgi:hypothetical protein
MTIHEAALIAGTQGGADAQPSASSDRATPPLGNQQSFAYRMALGEHSGDPSPARSALNAGSLSPAHVVALQRSVGNAAVASLLATPSARSPLTTIVHEEGEAEKADPTPFPHAGLPALEGPVESRAVTTSIQRWPGMTTEPRRPQQAGAGTAAKETPTTLENTVGMRVVRWRAAADRGVRSFVTQELEGAINNKPVDWQSFAIGLGGNLLWALTVATPEAGAAVNLFVSVVGILVSASAGGSPGEAAPKPPIAKTAAAIDHILNEVEMRFGHQIRTYAAEETAQHPELSVDELVDRVVRRLFDARSLRIIDGQTEINPDVVQADIETRASDLFHRFVQEVQPIGTTQFGHKTFAVIRIKGGRFDGQEAVALRSVDGETASYEFQNFVDDDLKQAAEARGEAASDIVTVVDHANIDGLYPHRRGRRGGS